MRGSLLLVLLLAAACVHRGGDELSADAADAAPERQFVDELTRGPQSTPRHERMSRHALRGCGTLAVRAVPPASARVVPDPACPALALEVRGVEDVTPARERPWLRRLAVRVVLRNPGSDPARLPASLVVRRLRRGVAADEAEREGIVVGPQALLPVRGAGADTTSLAPGEGSRPVVIELALAPAVRAVDAALEVVTSVAMPALAAEVPPSVPVDTLQRMRLVTRSEVPAPFAPDIVLVQFVDSAPRVARQHQVDRLRARVVGGWSEPGTGRWWMLQVPEDGTGLPALGARDALYAQWPTNSVALLMPTDGPAPPPPAGAGRPRDVYVMFEENMGPAALARMRRLVAAPLGLEERTPWKHEESDYTFMHLRLAARDSTTAEVAARRALAVPGVSHARIVRPNAGPFDDDRLYLGAGPPDTAAAIAGVARTDPDVAAFIRAARLPALRYVIVQARLPGAEARVFGVHYGREQDWGLFESRILLAWRGHLGWVGDGRARPGDGASRAGTLTLFPVQADSLAEDAFAYGDAAPYDSALAVVQQVATSALATAGGPPAWLERRRARESYAVRDTSPYAQQHHPRFAEARDPVARLIRYCSPGITMYPDQREALISGLDSIARRLADDPGASPRLLALLVPAAARDSALAVAFVEHPAARRHASVAARLASARYERVFEEAALHDAGVKGTMRRRLELAMRGRGYPGIAYDDTLAALVRQVVRERHERAAMALASRLTRWGLAPALRAELDAVIPDTAVLPGRPCLSGPPL